MALPGLLSGLLLVFVDETDLQLPIIELKNAQALYSARNVGFWKGQEY